MLTFAPMVDSETVRLLLRYHGIQRDERDHLFGWASVLTLFHGGYGVIPLVYGPGLRATGPLSLAQRCGALLPEADRLIPSEPALAARVADDWAAFNGGLGADVAVLAYYHLLPARALMQPIFAQPVPTAEARLTPRVYPLLAFAFRTLLRLTPARALAAQTAIRARFEEVDRRIADRRRYLCGDRPTLGDIGLAAASAPLLQPVGFGAAMPPIEAMPAALAKFIRELRAHPTAAFIDRLYRDGLVAASLRGD